MRRFQAARQQSSYHLDRQSETSLITAVQRESGLITGAAKEPSLWDILYYPVFIFLGKWNLTAWSNSFTTIFKFNVCVLPLHSANVNIFRFFGIGLPADI